MSGDLGAEVGLARLPALQRRLLDATLGRTTVFVAGQVLHHMTVSPRPTRSEVCHVGDLVERGVAGFVLSDETATGPHGPEAVARHTPPPELEGLLLVRRVRA